MYIYLDVDPTSSLDTLSKNSILKSIKKIAENSTLIIITDNISKYKRGGYNLCDG